MDEDLQTQIAMLTLKLSTNAVAALHRQGLLPEDQRQYCADEMRQVAELIDRLTDPEAEASKLAQQLHALATAMSRPRTDQNE